MRISVDLKDKGYSTEAFRARVYLNGTEVNSAITADEEEGSVYRYKLNENGHPMLDGSRTELATEIVYGDVRIEFE